MHEGGGKRKGYRDKYEKHFSPGANMSPLEYPIEFGGRKTKGGKSPLRGKVGQLTRGRVNEMRALLKHGFRIAVGLANLVVTERSPDSSKHLFKNPQIQLPTSHTHTPQQCKGSGIEKGSDVQGKGRAEPGYSPPKIHRFGTNYVVLITRPACGDDEATTLGLGVLHIRHLADDDLLLLHKLLVAFLFCGAYVCEGKPASNGQRGCT